MYEEKSRNELKKHLRSKHREDDVTKFGSRSLNSPNLSLEDRISNQCELDNWENALFINRSNIKKNIRSITKITNSKEKQPYHSQCDLPIIQNIKMGRASTMFNSIKSSPTRAKHSSFKPYESMINKYQSSITINDQDSTKQITIKSRDNNWTLDYLREKRDQDQLRPLVQCRNAAFSNMSIKSLSSTIEKNNDYVNSKSIKSMGFDYKQQIRLNRKSSKEMLNSIDVASPFLAKNHDYFSVKLSPKKSKRQFADHLQKAYIGPRQKSDILLSRRNSQQSLQQFENEYGLVQND